MKTNFTHMKLIFYTRDTVTLLQSGFVARAGQDMKSIGSAG